jgi:hypothetical protein
LRRGELCRRLRLDDFARLPPNPAAICFAVKCLRFAIGLAALFLRVVPRGFDFAFLARKGFTIKISAAIAGAPCKDHFTKPRLVNL